jgi:hypothetical protein
MIIVVIGVGMSCTKRYLDRKATSNDDFNNKAQVQVYNSTLNTQRVLVFADGARLSGTPMVYTQTTTTNATYSGSGITYLVQPGVHAMLIRDTLNTSTQPLLSFAGNYEANKFYTIFTYDSINTIKQITVETPIVIPSDTTARVRFANFVFQKPGIPPNVDVYSTRRKANVWSNIPITTVTDFMPYETKVADSLIVRPTGSLAGLDTTVFNFLPQRSYTLVFRGRYATNEAGGVNYPRVLTSFTNQ